MNLEVPTNRPILKTTITYNGKFRIIQTIEVNTIQLRFDVSQTNLPWTHFW